MKHGSLFSGIGGFDLAAEWMGWENVFHCEWNEFGQKVLNYYWPDAISYGDITKTNFTIHRGNIDILTGGFPCQPFSAAGKRKGTEDDRHLWPEMLRAIREIQPQWIVGENVPGIISWDRGLVFEQVCLDLEAEGYQVQPVILPAVSVNAPHRRDRVWFVAHSIDNRHKREIKRIDGKKNVVQGAYREEWRGSRVSNGAAILGDQGRGSGKILNKKKNDRTGDVTDPDNKGLQRSKEYRSVGEIGKNRNEQSTGSLRPGWQNFPTQPPICYRDDGLSYRLSGITFSKHRNESIKAYGNAIVPQIAYQIFKAIEAII